MAQEHEECDPVGLLEMAARLGVERQTARQWNFRRVLPEPDWTVSGLPAWNWSTIEAWAIRTGRLVEEDDGDG